jgi:hypothetical protein
MRDNLRLYRSILDHLHRFLPDERVTRRRNLALLMAGLFLARRVHLGHVVRKWPLRARIASLTNRLRRFLSNPRLDPVRLYRPFARLMLARLSEAPVRLILDVTKLGFRHRMLTVSVAYRRRALPLAWSVHRGRKGHVGAKDQKVLLEQIRPLVSPRSTVVVTGDSAFGQVALMRYLDRVGWGYVLRASSGFKVRVAAGAPWRRLDQIPLVEGQTRYVGPVAYTEKHGYPTHLMMHWGSGEKEPWLLVASEPVSRRTLREYRVRMWTEALYGDLKGHGFDLEATHLDDVGRLSRLVLGVCLVYVWLIALGSAAVKRGQRALVDRRSRRDKSYFRIGWDILEHRLRLGEPIPVRFAPYP